MARRPVSDLQTYALPAEPLEDGWGDKWDNDALEYRFERFGLRLKNGSTGYSVINIRTGAIVSLPMIDYEAFNRSREEICELISDLESAEVMLREQLSE